VYQNDRHAAIWSVLVHPNGAEFGWNVVHDIGLWTQCTKFSILRQIAAPCVRTLEPTDSETQGILCSGKRSTPVTLLAGRRTWFATAHIYAVP